jgi:hypothetical protein
VDDEVYLSNDLAGLLERGDDAEGLVVGGGRGLGDPHSPASAAIDEDQVGKSAAYVDACDDMIPYLSDILSHRRNPECKSFESLDFRMPLQAATLTRYSFVY